MMLVHILYASIVCVAAWLVTSIPRGSATVKYWIWTATSLNFLMPLALVPGRVWPMEVGWFTSRGVAIVADRVAIAPPLAIVWIGGAILMFARLLKAAASRRTPGTPSVTGLFRPEIVVPADAARMLTGDELYAVMLHEETHARRRDNLIGLLHEVVACLFWFHPLVWLTGSRLALYRELSCDERVVGHARGRDLLSALAKLACPENTSPLTASVTSHAALRVARLADPPRASRLATVLLAIAFAAIFSSAVITPAARAKAADTCAHVRTIR